MRSCSHTPPIGRIIQHKRASHARPRNLGQQLNLVQRPLLRDEDSDFQTGEWALIRWGFAPEEDDAAEVLK